jgi:beta-glucosidase
VLLKNTDQALPLAGNGKKIALIGQAAGIGAGLSGAVLGGAAPHGGGGSSHVTAIPVTPQHAITQRAAADHSSVTYADGTLLLDAVAAAKAADVAVVYANDTETEGSDRPNLGLNYRVCEATICASLPISQDTLISAVAKANPNTVVVLNTGGPVLMPWLNQVKAVVEAWYPGQQDGNAAAAVLFGDVNPAGKLPQTFPVSERDLPTTTPAQYPGVKGHTTYSEGLNVGYRWFDARDIEPLFPFGFGLSYTSFGYSDVRVSGSGDGARVSVTVTNTGHRAGAEVAQVYIDQPPSAHEPPKQLKGFRTVFPQPGQSSTVTMDLDARAFAHWDTGEHTWKITPGDYRVLIGSSSRDIRGQDTVTMAARTLDGS